MNQSVLPVAKQWFARRFNLYGSGVAITLYVCLYGLGTIKNRAVVF